ncbi:hypothetical protein Tco_1499115 [Tanacetum coccineum]
MIQSLCPRRSLKKELEQEKVKVLLKPQDRRTNECMTKGTDCKVEDIARSGFEEERKELGEAKSTRKINWENDPSEDVAEDVESLSIKYPIVDWKTYTLTENFMYYQIFRGDGSSKNYKVLSEMLEDFDRQDVKELYRLVKESHTYADREEIPSKSIDDFQDVEKEIRDTNGVSTANTNLVLPELVNTARRKINTADGRSC